MQGLHKLVHTSYQNLASTQKHTNNVHVALLHNKWQHASCQIKYVSPSANITNSRRASLLSYYAVFLHDCLVTGYHDVQLYMRSTILFGLWTDMISATKNSTQYHPLASWVAYLEKKVQLFYLTKQMNLCKYLVHMQYHWPLACLCAGSVIPESVDSSNHEWKDESAPKMPFSQKKKKKKRMDYKLMPIQLLWANASPQVLYINMRPI